MYYTSLIVPLQFHSTPTKSSEPKLEPRKGHFWEYCENTSIHGLRYLTDDQTPYYERFLWILGIAFCIMACGVLIRQAWVHWRSSPVIVGMDERMRPIREIPFPAITICPLARVNQEAFNFTTVMNNLQNLNESELNTLLNLQLQCEGVFYVNASHNSTHAIDTIELFTLPTQETIEYFSFSNLRYNHTSMGKIMTEVGLCYTFNMLTPEFIFRPDTFHASKKYLSLDKKVDVGWSISGGYTSERESSYPRRSYGAGKSSGALMALKVHSNHRESLCSKSFQGFRVILSSPAYLPKVDQHSFFVPLDAAVNVAVTPKEVRTSNHLREIYSPEQRQCYFPNERYLRFFKEYSQHNCEIECLANVTLLFCHCVAFYMPRMLDTKICSIEKETCVKEAKMLLQAAASGMNEMKENTETERLFKTTMTCECPDSCSSLSYQTDRTHVHADIRGGFDSHYKQTGNNLTRYLYHKGYRWTMMWIYFEESQFFPLRRMELYDKTTFIANCGGVLGLCLGISILSVVEIFYWMLVRPLTRLCKVLLSRRKPTTEIVSKENQPQTYPRVFIH